MFEAEMVGNHVIQAGFQDSSQHPQQLLSMSRIPSTLQKAVVGEGGVPVCKQALYAHPQCTSNEKLVLFESGIDKFQRGPTNWN